MEIEKKTLNRIISNEKIVTQLECMYASIKDEIDGGVNDYIEIPYECRKYNIDLSGIVSAVLGALRKLESLNTKTKI